MLKHRLSAACILAVLLAPAAVVIAQPAGDATTVSDVEVTAPEQVPVPNVGIGAPLYTIPELEEIRLQARKDSQDAMSDARRCEQSRGERVTGNFLQEYDAATAIRASADAAVDATGIAEQVRREAARGLRTQKEVEDAELARQAVVRRLVAARAAFQEAQAVSADLIALELERPKPPPRTGGVPPSRDMYPTPEEWISRHHAYLVSRAQQRQYVAGQRVRPLPTAFADLVLENLTVREGEDRRGRFLVVSGAIRNPRPAAIPTPPLSITVLDRFGFPLAAELADPKGAGRIRTGQAQLFTYEFRPRPGSTDTVLVTFGSDEYEPWRLPVGAMNGECPVLSFDMPKPQEGVLPSPLDPTPAARRPRK